MRILVTGASGFIGSHVCAEMARDGGEIRALCRSEPPPLANVAEWVQGDITDRTAVARATRGCEAVVHAAALYSYARSHRARMDAVNVEGTRLLMRECVRSGVRRVLITSSSATCGPVAGRSATELDAPPAWELRVPYKRTKMLAENLALAAASDGPEVLCVNPTTVVGAGDSPPTPSGRMIRDLVNGRIRGYLPGAGINVVSVRDVARGHALAMGRGRSGHRYILGGDDLRLREAFGIVLAAVGRAGPRWPLPWHAAYGAALFADLLGRAFGHEPRLIVRDEVRLSRTPLYFSSEKARSELGYDPAPAVAALTDAARWFDSHRSARHSAAPRLVPAH